MTYRTRIIVAGLLISGLCPIQTTHAQLTTNVVEHAESDSFPLSKNHAAFEQYEKIQLTPRFSKANYAKAYVVNINTQNDFDRLQDLVTSALKGHKTVLVSIGAGTYTYKQKHLNLTDLKAKGKSLYITGKGEVKLIGASSIYESGDVHAETTTTGYSLPTQETFLHTTGLTDGSELLPVASSDHFTGGRLIELDSLIEVVDAGAKICRAKLPASLSWLKKSEKACNDLYIKVTEWYLGQIMKVNRIDDGYVYFTYPNLDKGYQTEWNINNDYGFHMVYHNQPRNPRIQLINLDDDPRGISFAGGRVNIPNKYQRVYVCNNGVFVQTGNTELSELEIAGLTFLCNGGTRYDALINLGKSKIKNGVAIHDNQFVGIKTLAVYTDTPDVTFYDNTVRHAYISTIEGTNEAANLCVYHNYFENINEQIHNTFAIHAAGPAYYIARNTIKNFAYGGINVGVHFSLKMPNTCDGIVEFNHLYWDDAYLALNNNRGLMDSGAIYITTMNTRSIIRYNWLYNYGGAGANRGIFCDDGVNNTAIYGNVVSNVVNSLPIDLRSVTTIAKYVPNHNENNCIMYNIIDGRCLFFGKKDVDNNVLGENIVVYKETRPVRRLRFFDQPEDDFYVKGEILRDRINVRRAFFLNRSSLPLSPEITRCIFGEFY